MSAWARPVLIAGIGSEFRSDDGAGLVAARRLQLALAGEPDVRVIDAPGHLASLIDDWRGIATTIVIDAMVSGRAPGSVLRCEWLPDEGCRFASTHDFTLQEAIGVARQLGVLPATVVVYGIEVGSSGYGVSLSPAVEDAVERVVEEVMSGVRGQV